MSLNEAKLSMRLSLRINLEKRGYMITQGKVLWFSEQDGNGIIVDNQGNEHYTDISVIEGRTALKRNQQVTFKLRLIAIRCAVDVRILS